MSIFSSEEQSNVFHVGLGFCSFFMLHLYAFLLMCVLGTTDRAAYIPFWVMWQGRREGLIMEPSQHSKMLSICFFHKDALQYYFSPEIFFSPCNPYFGSTPLFLTWSSFCWLLPPWKNWFISLTFLLTSWQMLRSRDLLCNFFPTFCWDGKIKKQIKVWTPNLKDSFWKDP